MKLRALIHKKMAYKMVPFDDPRSRLYRSEATCVADTVGAFGLPSDCEASCPLSPS